MSINHSIELQIFKTLMSLQLERRRLFNKSIPPVIYEPIISKMLASDITNMLKPLLSRLVACPLFPAFCPLLLALLTVGGPLHKLPEQQSIHMSSMHWVLSDMHKYSVNGHPLCRTVFVDVSFRK